MADVDLKNFPPEERVKRLKELEEQKNKEIEEAKKLIKESEEEIIERRKWKDKVPMPEFVSGSLEGLSTEVKDILKTERGLNENQKIELELEKEFEERLAEKKKREDLETLTINVESPVVKNHLGYEVNLTVSTYQREDHQNKGYKTNNFEDIKYG